MVVSGFSSSQSKNLSMLWIENGGKFVKLLIGSLNNNEDKEKVFAI